MNNISTGKLDADPQSEPVPYQAFAKLASDWIWELDENLCFVLFEGTTLLMAGAPCCELIGRNRIDVLSESMPASDVLDEHHKLLREHKNIDLIMPVLLGAEITHVNIIAQAQFHKNGKFTGYKGCGRDVSKRVARETKLAHQAAYDDLTGVINRREFERKLGELQQQAQTSSELHTLCFLDLDRFKHVNDTGGHHAGDQLLRELCCVIKKHVQSGETLARLGGDEFGLLLKSDASAAAVVAEKIIDEISRYNFIWENNTFNVGVSIGIAEITTESTSVESLMVKADAACYFAKNNGRNQSHIADDDVVARADGSGRVGAIKQALKNNQYKLLMQPIASNTKVEAFQRYELLLRLECNDGELLQPGEFMPLAKHYALLQELDCWVVENALQALETLHAENSDVALSINLSTSTLANVEALNRIVEIFENHTVPIKRVCFDIAETYAIRNIEIVSDFMKELKDYGVEFALDDFGNGLSSFTCLQQLPIDYLKIDGELIRKISTDTTVRCIAESLHQLSQKLGIKTIAESVEDATTIECVKEMGFNYMQGFGVADLIEFEILSSVNLVHGRD